MREPNEYRIYTMFTLRLMGEIGAWIGAPIVLFSWLGRTADATLGTKPKLMALSFLVSFVVSTIGLCVRAADFGEEYEQLTDGPPRALADPGSPGVRGGPPEDGRIS